MTVVEESSEGAVVVVDAFSSLIEHQETITAMLTIRTNQFNKTFILFVNLENIEKVGLKSHKFKLFNSI